MAVRPIPTEHLVALLGGAGIPSRKEETMHNPSFWHIAAEAFFIAVLALALWGTWHVLGKQDERDGF